METSFLAKLLSFSSTNHSFDPKRMSFTLLPATIEDVPALTKLHFESFLSTCTLEKQLYPRGASSIVLSSSIETRLRSFKKPHIRYIKVVDFDNDIAEDSKQGMIFRWGVCLEMPVDDFMV